MAHRNIFEHKFEGFQRYRKGHFQSSTSVTMLWRPANVICDCLNDVIFIEELLWWYKSTFEDQRWTSSWNEAQNPQVCSAASISITFTGELKPTDYVRWLWSDECHSLRKDVTTFEVITSGWSKTSNNPNPIHFASGKASHNPWLMLNSTSNVVVNTLRSRVASQSSEEIYTSAEWVLLFGNG